MAAFVIPAKEEEGIGVPDLQRPEIQNALKDATVVRIRYTVIDGEKHENALRC